jgi:hypothetical protein
MPYYPVSTARRDLSQDDARVVFDPSLRRVAFPDFC